MSAEQSSYNRQESNWLKVQELQAQATETQQISVSDLDQNTKRSKYWRFIVQSIHGGAGNYLRVDDLKLNTTG